MNSRIPSESGGMQQQHRSLQYKERGNGQQPGPDNPVFTPDGSIDWLLARTVVESADGNYHQAVSHLGRSHFGDDFGCLGALRHQHPVASRFCLGPSRLATSANLVAGRTSIAMCSG